MILVDDRMERKIKLKSLNPHISCKICKGYLIEATTVTECLHTFCKSCLVKHLEEHNTCPTCDIVIHQSHPLNYISYDRTMQDIVYKLVTHLQTSETKREKDFYRKRGLPYPKANLVPGNEKDVPLGKLADPAKVVNGSGDVETKKSEPIDYHRADEQVNIVLESYTGSMKQMKRKFIRCSEHTTVTHIKKFVSMKLYKTMERHKDIDILCDDELLGKDHTLKFVNVTRWRSKEPPIILFYRPKLDL
ncbi:Polycomb group RING finger protein 3 [Halotydeus destructor]|nr:Polycomb group RING finger protein 3 [Halotydeus destructor]